MRSERREARNVIPRWRPLASVEGHELASVGRFSAETHENSSEDFQDSASLWKKERSLAAGVDLFDAYILTGDRSLLRMSLSILKENADAIPPRVKDAFRLSLKRPDPVLDVRQRISNLETNQEYVFKSISVIKNRLKSFPREALSYLELGRLYTLLGQFELAEQKLAIARTLAPDNRAILRATLSFYDTVSALEEGLACVRRSPLLGFDPWIQSAEIATSTILGRPSRAASHRFLKFDKSGQITRETTELAMALATLDQDSGVKERKVFQLVRSALPNSTENGFSQAVWLSEISSRDFSKRFPDAEPGPEAHEARVQIACEQKQFEDAAVLALAWLHDQPFSIEAVLHYLHLASVHTTPTSEAVAYAKRYSQIFSDNWQVLNACFLTLVEGGEVAAAEQNLTRLDRLVPDDCNRAFCEAARGLIAFAKGDFATGRTSYERATRISADHQRFDLVVNSTIFWLRSEAKNKLISDGFVDRTIKAIESAIKRVDHIHRNYLENVWHSSKAIIAQSQLAQEEAGDDICRVAIHALDQGELFSRNPLSNPANSHLPATRPQAVSITHSEPL